MMIRKREKVPFVNLEKRRITEQRNLSKGFGTNPWAEDRIYQLFPYPTSLCYHSPFFFSLLRLFSPFLREAKLIACIQTISSVASCKISSRAGLFHAISILNHLYVIQLYNRPQIKFPKGMILLIGVRLISHAEGRTRG